MTFRVKKKAMLGLTTMLIAATALTACGSKTENAPSASAGTDNAPLDVNIMTILLSANPPANDNAIKQAIEKATNSKLNIQWVSANSYPDKLNVTLASGDIPELIYIPDPFTSVFRGMVQQGAFWDLTDYIKDYPNLTSKISKTAWGLTKMEDGKNYAIPRPRPTEGDTFFIFRKDWLDNLGLKVPTTTDELYQVYKAFTENDPDKNGKNDTIGLAVNATNGDKVSDTLGQVENSFAGSNGDWKWTNDQMVFKAFQPEEHKALEFMTKLYKEKLIPEDFASLKTSQVKDLVKTGKAGGFVDKTGTVVSDYLNDLKKIDSKVKETDFYPATNINGYNPKGPGFSGVLAIPKTVKEDKMKRILKLVDTWMNEDVFAIQSYGMEGVDHTVKDGVKVVDSKKLADDGGPDFNQIVYVADPYASTVKNFFQKDTQELYRKIQDERAKTSQADISIGLYSPTAMQYLPELQKKVLDMKVKVILGKETLDAWDEFVKQTQADPNVVKMSQEMTDAYKKRIAAK
ncbi:type 2 periplasmic-binding domain-containing protein [Paenibacillus hexagrammi]|uniref:Extracellular solute-binding protein n=1 Tax=Paenibacillus hexagrammi TaxID=2908839 RepID=A0ABY3SLF6_9BACL|nr:extracellular solute-binding protein [Paenibacillus sp. YPD9-1]UJF34897.1 extracellular solute-binding protein [Paenibacillus sp. YPD9-1]